jgi:phosphopantothenoylcysteine decarboxylase/phosphopantothenate--cysteine ligase
MAAAPADFRPADYRGTKIKKTDETSAPIVTLVQNPDILAELVRQRTTKLPVIVGFAAETGDATGSVLEHGHVKLARKGCDLLVVNDVSAGKVFESTENAAVVLAADGTSTEVPHGPKEALADVVWDLVSRRLPG